MHPLAGCQCYFQYETVVRRWPIILTGNVDQLHRENHDLRIQKPLSSTKSIETTFSQTAQRDLWFFMTLSFAIWFSFFYVLDVICAFAFAFEVKKIERTECLEAFLANKCNDPVPFACDECIKMDLCLKRSITNVGYGRLAVESLASMVNGFLEPISLKALVRLEIHFNNCWN
ncbi:MAG: hypothetical protein NXY57DRAFT_1041971 [Lentinula lateritia]|nr:MAG: hypothetical protein NXY57DRAFT_1041971 [Lentinula lateritia]